MADKFSMEKLNSLVLTPGTGKTISIAGAQVIIKAASADTGGQWAMFEYVSPPQFRGPAPHWHKTTQESFYILEGTVRVRLDEEVIEVTPGTFLFVPPGVMHSFANMTDDPARMVITVSPGGLEDYFAELARQIESEPVWPPTNMSKVLELAARYDTYSPPTP